MSRAMTFSLELYQDHSAMNLQYNMYNPMWILSMFLFLYLRQQGILRMGAF